MRHDFEGEFYEIEIQITDYYSHKKTKIRWTRPNFDHFGHPKGFSSSDRGWQDLGRHCTFSLAEARRALKWISSRYPDNKFRLVKREVSWLSSVVCNAEVPR